MQVSYQFKDLYQCIKSHKNNTKVLVITNDTPREKLTYYLPSMEIRERFCEIMWLGLCGIKSVANYTVCNKKSKKEKGGMNGNTGERKKQR